MERIIVGTVGTACKLFLNGFCTVKVENLPFLLEAISSRNQQPLITIMNHNSVLDDPLLWGVLPLNLLWTPSKLRWSMGAQEILFTNALYSWFFHTGRTISIHRGSGIHQKGMNDALAILKSGGWVNIFPEARVNQSDSLLPFKWGIARLLLESETTPLVIPIAHKGLIYLI